MMPSLVTSRMSMQVVEYMGLKGTTSYEVGRGGATPGGGVDMGIAPILTQEKLEMLRCTRYIPLTPCYNTLMPEGDYSCWWCEVCGHVWLKNGPDKPKQCAKCRSRRWDDGIESKPVNEFAKGGVAGGLRREGKTGEAKTGQGEAGSGGEVVYGGIECSSSEGVRTEIVKCPKVCFCKKCYGRRRS